MTSSSGILPSMPPPPPHWTNASELSPPPIPTGKHIYVFGAPINRTHEDRLAQDEADILEKTKKASIDTRVSSLKQLNRTVLVKFLQLTSALVRSSEDYEERVRELKAALMNFQHLLNQFRPHEARETIITMLEKQLERRKQVLEILKERMSAADTIIAEAKSRLSKRLSRIDQEELPPSSDIFSEVNNDNFSANGMDVTESAPTPSEIQITPQAGLRFLGPFLDSI